MNKFQIQTLVLAVCRFKFCECINVFIAFKGHFFYNWFGVKHVNSCGIILCRLPEKGRREIEEIVEEMRERDRRERKINESEETEEINSSPFTLSTTCCKDSRPCPTVSQQVGRPGDVRYTTPLPHPATPFLLETMNLYQVSSFKCIHFNTSNSLWAIYLVWIIMLIVTMYFESGIHYVWNIIAQSGRTAYPKH